MTASVPGVLKEPFRVDARVNSGRASGAELIVPVSD